MSSDGNFIRKRSNDFKSDHQNAYEAYGDCVEPRFEVDFDRYSSDQSRPDQRLSSGIEDQNSSYEGMPQLDHPSPLKRLKQYAFGSSQPQRPFSLVGSSAMRRQHTLLAPKPLSSWPNYSNDRNQVSESQIIDSDLRRCGSGEDSFKRKNCDECVKRKIKCDGQQPCCTCVRKRLSCTYSYKMKPGPKVRPTSPNLQKNLRNIAIECKSNFCSDNSRLSTVGYEQPMNGSFHFSNYQGSSSKHLLGASRLLPSFRGLSGFKGGAEPPCPPLATAPVTPSLNNSSIHFPEMFSAEDDIPLDVTHALLALKHSK